MREFALIPPITVKSPFQNEKQSHPWAGKKAPWVVDSRCILVVFFFLLLLQAGRHNHTNKTSKIDWELKYAAENYSNCFGMAGRKIFPQSVRLDEIKTVILCDARVNDTDILFIWSEGLGSSWTSCHVAAVGGQSLLFWSLACSLSVTMWTHVHASPSGPPRSRGNSAKATKCSDKYDRICYCCSFNPQR